MVNVICNICKFHINGYYKWLSYNIYINYLHIPLIYIYISTYIQEPSYQHIYSINYCHIPLIYPLISRTRPQIPELDAAILAAGGHTGPGALLGVRAVVKIALW